MKLSIGMMVKNEEKHLEKCLQSLKPIMQAVSSELIIVDTGSEDSTVEIARKYTDKVYFHPWNGDFAAMRNITISYSKGEWFFVIDGDEVVENPKGLISFLNSSKSKKYNSGFVRIKNFLSENDEHNAVSAFILRLFRRDKDFCYRGKIHEQPVFKGPTAEIKTTLLHYGYINTDKELMERKYQRNIALLKSEVEKDPENIYYWFQLSQSYSMHKDYPEALEAILKAYALVKDKKLDIKKYMYVLAKLAINYMQNKKYAEAEDVYKEALKINDGYPDFYYYLGNVQALMWKNSEAIANLHAYLTKVKEFEKTGVRDLSMPYYSLGEVEKAYSNLAVLYNRQEEYEKALECLEKIKSKHIFKDLSLNPFINYLDACFKLKSYARIKDYYDRVVSLQEEDVEELFFVALEKSLLKSPPEDKTIIQQLFAAGESDYALLQKVRLAIDEGRSLDDKQEAKIRELDFNERPEYYGNVLYYLLKNDFPITSILQNVRERKIDSLLSYVKNVYDDLSLLLFRYLEKQEADGAAGQTLAELIINKTFAKYLLVLDKLSEEQYEYIFNRYIEYGDKYIRIIYNEDIVQNERIAVVKDEEDAFLLYMSLAEAHKNRDKVKYLRYLRKALKEYPLLKKGIEIKLKKVQESVENVEADVPSRSPQLFPQDSAANSELESYKRQVKDNLEKLINAGRTQEAKEIIQQYETLVSGDAEIYSMKGIIGIIENNLEEAEKNLREGLKFDEQNFDLLYNLAYVYERSQKFPEAYEYYSRARDICPEATLNAELEKKIEKLMKYIPDESPEITDNGFKGLSSLTKIENNRSEVDIDKVNDMQLLQKQFKENIQLLIDQGLLKEAKEMVGEYEKIIKNDVDTYSIKGIIAMMAGDMDEAERLFREGLTIKPLNQDLLYNIAILCENQRKYADAFKFYNKLLKKTTCEDTIINDIKSRLKNLEQNDFVKQYIALNNNLTTTPTITIETWVYNSEAYLVQCIESVLNQSFEDFEWVIIDNGSTDNSSKILEQYAKEDKRIKLFKNKENTFIYKKPMNQSFVEYTENLASEYWCMLDSDDFLHKDFLKELYFIAKKYDADVVVAGTEMFKEENEKIKVLRCPPVFFTNNIRTLGDIFPQIYGCFRPVWGKLFKVSVLRRQLEYNRKNLKFLMTNAADTIFCIDFLKHCKSVAGLNKPLHYYRIRKNSAYNSMVYKNRYLEYIKIYNDTKSLLESWSKLDEQNLNFITAVLYHSIKDCIQVAINSQKASLKEKTESIIAILSDKRMRHLLNNNGLYTALLDEGLDALNCLIQ